MFFTLSSFVLPFLLLVMSLVPFHTTYYLRSQWHKPSQVYPKKDEWERIKGKWSSIINSQSALTKMTSLTIFRLMNHEKQPVVLRSLHSGLKLRAVNVVRVVSLILFFFFLTESFLLCHWRCCCYSYKDDREQIAYCRERVVTCRCGCETERISVSSEQSVQRMRNDMQMRRQK